MPHRIICERWANVAHANIYSQSAPGSGTGFSSLRQRFFWNVNNPSQCCPEIWRWKMRWDLPRVCRSSLSFFCLCFYVFLSLSFRNTDAQNTHFPGCFSPSYFLSSLKQTKPKQKKKQKNSLSSSVKQAAPSFTCHLRPCRPKSPLWHRWVVLPYTAAVGTCLTLLKDPVGATAAADDSNNDGGDSNNDGSDSNNDGSSRVTRSVAHINNTHAQTSVLETGNTVSMDVYSKSFCLISKAVRGNRAV